MLVYTAIVFALAATFGATMAARHFRGKDVPMALPLIHGMLVIAGFALLGYVLLTRSVSPIIWVVFGFFVMAAIGGLILFRSYWCRRPLSSGMIVIHAMVAGMGLLFLLIFLVARGLAETPSDRPQVGARQADHALH